MMTSVQLRQAEVLLLDIAQAEYDAALKTAQSVFQARTSAIFASHGLPLGTQGTLQRDPLDKTTVRLLFDDGTEAASGPQLVAG